MTNPFYYILLAINIFENDPSLNKYISDIFANIEYFRRDPIGMVEINIKIIQLKMMAVKNVRHLAIRRVADRVVQYIKSDDVIPETKLIQELNLQDDIEIIHSNYELENELKDKLQLVENILIQDLMRKEEVALLRGLRFEKKRLQALVSNGEISILEYYNQVAVFKIKRDYFEDIKEIRLNKLRNQISWNEMENCIYLYTKKAYRNE